MQLKHTLANARDFLRPVHDSYVTTISSRGMALSLETSALVWALCNELRPATIVDLGSGFSSYVVRKWVQLSGEVTSVWSVDDDHAWLGRSQEFCEQLNVNTSNFSTWEAFAPTGTFDLIVYDLGRMQVRDANVGRALDMLSPAGVAVMDDMHKYNYGLTVKRTIEEHSLYKYDMRGETTDAHEGRHCWLASKEPLQFDT